MKTQTELSSTQITLSFAQWETAKKLANERMKANNGHYFFTILKTRCQYCGRSPRAKGRCRAWFQTFLSQLDIVMLNIEREELRLDVPVARPVE